jgi:hypothetical protein
MTGSGRPNRTPTRPPAGGLSAIRDKPNTHKHNNTFPTAKIPNVALTV